MGIMRFDSNCECGKGNHNSWCTSQTETIGSGWQDKSSDETACYCEPDEYVMEHGCQKMLTVERNDLRLSTTDQIEIEILGKKRSDTYENCIDVLKTENCFHCQKPFDNVAIYHATRFTLFLHPECVISLAVSMFRDVSEWLNDPTNKIPLMNQKVNLEHIMELLSPQQAEKYKKNRSVYVKWLRL